MKDFIPGTNQGIIATLLLAAQHNEPLDEAVFSEVMFNKDTSGEVPEHRDFIYDRLKPFCEKELGIKFTILHADKTYDEVFHHVITRGPHKGEVRGFAWAGNHSFNLLARNGVRIEGNTVTQNGEPLFKIHRRHAARKTQGCYRELMPTLEYVKQEQKQEKPSIRDQLKAAAKQQPEKKSPVKSKTHDMEL